MKISKLTLLALMFAMMLSIFVANLANIIDYSQALEPVAGLERRYEDRPREYDIGNSYDRLMWFVQITSTFTTKSQRRITSPTTRFKEPSILARTCIRCAVDRSFTPSSRWTLASTRTQEAFQFRRCAGRAGTHDAPRPHERVAQEPSGSRRLVRTLSDLLHRRSVQGWRASFHWFVSSCRFSPLCPGTFMTSRKRV
ncbi:unnamed protein product [Trichogramma brassicae]|uniref:Uncharacterized protein n=1 Tax=Trichogramma brassicae TaxID=86971 RepID=A0A6H5IT34_9HYME|nr:unnamed protein product [Trichogramma brassicae]